METIGVRAAARELGVAPSTISRQIASGLIPNRGTEDEPKVNLEEARQVRATMLDPNRRSLDQVPAAESEEEAEDLSGLEVEGPPQGENSEGARRAPGITDPAYVAARVERAKIATKMATLEYERAAGLVILKADVDAAIVDATRLLRDELLRVGDKVALEVSTVTDPVQVAAIIRKQLRELLEQFSARLGAQKE